MIGKLRAHQPPGQFPRLFQPTAVSAGGCYSLSILPWLFQPANTTSNVQFNMSGVTRKNKQNQKEAKVALLNLCKKYPDDIWFNEKLSRIYAFEKNWKLAHDTINNLKKINVKNFSI